jgi:anhydro-N-acetylmuramic acid kinase
MPTEPDTRERIIAGAMSGTSADGVDVALTRITGRGTSMTATLVHHHHRSYDAATRDEIFAFRGGDATCNLARLARLGRKISLTDAKAVNEALAAAHLSAKDLAAVAAHGQTLYHGPPDTIQWFDPSLVAAEVGCPVVSDFRRADLAAGGQGAPLVPFADYILFRHPTKNRVLLNIGGIANLTYLRAGGSIDDVIAFDTGPGNCVSDWICRTEYSEGPGYDDNGSLARRGKLPAREVFSRRLALPYFRAKPPKSTDGPAMIAAFTSIKETRNLPFLDRVATATLFTVTSIQLAMKAFLPGGADELIVSGGGTKNFTIMHHLREGFEGEVKMADELGVRGDAKEALAFALLGAATLDGAPSNVPSVTGARRGVVLGSMTPRP